MERGELLNVIVDGVKYAYPSGTLYKKIAADFQEKYSYDILLVNRNGKLCELHKALDRDCMLKMITAEQKPHCAHMSAFPAFAPLYSFSTYSPGPMPYEARRAFHSG